MTRNKTILLAFAGQEIDQVEGVSEIGDGYECLNLRKFCLEKFIVELQAKIPPVNKNVLRNYTAEDERADFGITEKAFRECSWGLLIPDSLDDAIATSYGEPLFLINLYSAVFLYPLFCAGDYGIEPVRTRRRIVPHQDQSCRFTTIKFVKFFTAMLAQSQYAGLSMDRAKRWNQEEWRLYVAARLFTGLQDYDDGKEAFGWWQRESADMGTILESLLTEVDRRHDFEKKLKQRAAVLLSHRFPAIRDDIEELYEQRSRFVHGQFYAKVADQIAKNPDDLPKPDFELLSKHRERIRCLIVAYLHLSQVLRNDATAYPGMKSVIDVLEKAASGDSQVADRVSRDVDEVFALL